MQQNMITDQGHAWQLFESSNLKGYFIWDKVIIPISDLGPSETLQPPFVL
jgi:hypothetical protein